MRAIEKKNFRRIRRTRRVRGKVVGSADRPRLVVVRSLKNMYAQVVDDATGATLCAASTLQSAVLDQAKSAGNVAAAKAVGKAIAEAALAKSIKKVCFDRGGRKYHGRVKALADSAREAGLQF